MNYVFLLLGSNIGNRHLLMESAVTAISEKVGEVIISSSIYETQSWGRANEPDYLNQVLQLVTEMPATEVLKTILEIEKEMGRERIEKWGARTIDIDILFYNSDIISLADLKVPHPELHKRRFTVEPLAEIAPGFIHPALNMNMLQLKALLTDDLMVKKL